MTVSLKLTTPIQAHGETVNTLEFRAPNGKDLAECGLPFTTESEGGRATMKPDTRSVSKLISSLAAIPDSSVGMLSGLDYLSAMGVVMDFFADTATPPTS